jgi:predicted lipoprotein with Yx(FWY)xxD motif
MIASHDWLKIPNRRRRALLVVPAVAAGLAALAACSSSSSSSSSAPSTAPASSSAPAASSSAPAAGSRASATGSAAAGPGSASGAAAAAAVGLKTATIGGVTVLTNAKGFALYSFAPDTATKSACSGACAAAWPPQTASGTVKSPYTTIKRSDGTTQLVFDGHPLYTYIADTSPGTASGNGVNAFGGVWHEVPAAGGAAPAGSASAGSGGVGY